MLMNQLLRETVVLILGGGRGSRLFPLTLERCKPAVPLGGKFRFIDVALSNCINSGLRQLFVLTQYNSASLNNHVSTTYKFDAFSPDFVAILAAEERAEQDVGWFQGTADAVRRSLRYIKDPNWRNVLILPGDHLCRINLRHMIERHARTGADVTLCAAVVGREEAARFRVFRLGRDGRIVDYVRKPTSEDDLARFRLSPLDRAMYGIGPETYRDEAYLAFMGIYLFKTEKLAAILTDPDMTDLGRDVLPGILFTTHAVCHVFNGYWRDIGTISTFYEASMDLTDEHPPFRFHHKDGPIFTHARFLPAARVYGSRLDGAMVADGAIIHRATIERSVIGVRARIGEGTHISHSVLFGADAYEGDDRRAAARTQPGLPPLGIGPKCMIRKAIIDKNARIGAGCRLLNDEGLTHFDGEHFYIRDGVIIIPKGAVLEPGTII